MLFKKGKGLRDCWSALKQLKNGKERSGGHCCSRKERVYETIVVEQSACGVIAVQEKNGCVEARRKNCKERESLFV